MRVRADHPAPAAPLRRGPVESPGSLTGDASLGTAAGPAGRVSTSLPELVEHVAAEYRLGPAGDWSVLATGYEDCNIDLRAGQTRVGIKVFAAGRPAGIAPRTAGIIAAVTAAGVRHPRLHADAAGSDVHTYDRHRLLVMDFAPGQTFYDLGRPPDEAELAKVVAQAALIHGTQARPEPVFDSWAIANLIPLAGKGDDLLDREQSRARPGRLRGPAQRAHPRRPDCGQRAARPRRRDHRARLRARQPLAAAAGARGHRGQPAARLPGRPAGPDGQGRPAVLGGRPAAAQPGRAGRPARRRPRRRRDGAARRPQPVAAGQPRPGDRLPDRHRHHRPARLRPTGTPARPPGAGPSAPGSTQGPSPHHGPATRSSSARRPAAARHRRTVPIVTPRNRLAGYTDHRGHFRSRAAPNRTR